MMQGFSAVDFGYFSETRNTDSMVMKGTVEILITSQISPL